MDHPHPSLLYKIPPSHLRGPTYWLGSSLFSCKPLSVAEDGRAEAEELGLGRGGSRTRVFARGQAPWRRRCRSSRRRGGGRRTPRRTPRGGFTDAFHGPPPGGGASRRVGRRRRGVPVVVVLVVAGPLWGAGRAHPLRGGAVTRSGSLGRAGCSRASGGWGACVECSSHIYNRFCVEESPNKKIDEHEVDWIDPPAYNRHHTTLFPNPVSRGNNKDR